MLLDKTKEIHLRSSLNVGGFFFLQVKEFCLPLHGNI